SMDRIPGLEADAMLAIATAAPEAYTKLVTALTGANELIKKGAAFAELGGSGAGAGAGGAHEKLDAIATGLRATNPKLSKAQAFSAACDANPELTRELRAEQRKGA